MNISFKAKHAISDYFLFFFFARKSNYEMKLSDIAGFLPINRLRADVLSPKVPFLRNNKTANDFATTFDVIEETLNHYLNQNQYFDNILCLSVLADYKDEFETYN